MEVSFTRFPWWNWGGKEKDNTVCNGNGSNSLNSSCDSVKFGSVKGGKMKMPSSSRRIKRKWRSREERRIDKEYDVVLVPSDGVCLSGSESEDSDWSIGWLEPHAPGFHSSDDDGDERDDSFAVLVPCYRNENGGNLEEEEINNQFLSAIKNFPDGYSAGKGFCFFESIFGVLHCCVYIYICVCVELNAKRY